eukprot:TRINITY_DN5958_c0_g1_i1.p1 TRINITY_DN5958_c0_g1~~TRINITY_DN5958_c0_g1_i1.p1  ORF type:complete len:470 (-),score=119.74 TRINITY_DN5958_c0_g1_i1:20-1429(-)
MEKKRSRFDEEEDDEKETLFRTKKPYERPDSVLPNQTIKPIQLVDGGRLRYTREKLLESLGYSSGDDKVLIVTVMGKFRIGKSHLQNRLFFNGTSMFEVGKQAMPVTSGIWIARCKRKPGYPDLMVIDTEGLEALNDQPVEASDGMEDQIRSVLGVIVAMSDIVLYLVKSNAIDKTDFAGLETEAMKFMKLYAPHLVQHGNTVWGERDNYYGKAGGPALLLAHRSDGEIDFQNPDLVGNITRACHLTMAQDASKSGPFGSFLYFPLPKDDDTKYDELLDKVLDFAKIGDGGGRPSKPIGGWFEVLEIMMSYFSKPPPFVAEYRRWVQNTYTRCQAKCTACSQQCCKFLFHKGLHEAAKGARCKYDARLDNQVWFCKQKHAPSSYDDPEEIASKKLEVRPSFMDFKGRQFFCRGCGLAPIATDFVRSGLFWVLASVNPDKEKNVEEFITHSFPGEQTIPKETEPKEEKTN